MAGPTRLYLIFFCVSTISIFSISCGYNQKTIPAGYTEVRINSGRQHFELSDYFSLGSAQIAFAQLGGGVFIYALGDGSFSTNFRLQDEISGGSFVLPNGNYRFAAFGYEGLGLTVPLRCGMANDSMPIGLWGGTVEVGLTLSTAGCESTHFTPASYWLSLTPKTLDIAHCPYGNTPGQFEPANLATSTCSDLSSTNPWSIRIGFPIFTANGSEIIDLNSGGPGPENSVCIGFNPTSDLTTSTITVPYGDSTEKLWPNLVTWIGLYDSLDCGGSVMNPPKWKFEFPHGLINVETAKRIDPTNTVAPAYGTAAAKIFPGSSYARLFLLN